MIAITIILFSLFSFVFGYAIAWKRSQKIMSLKERRSFVTGSLAYGHNYRNKDSDVDIVVYLNEDDIETLWPFVKARRDPFLPFVSDSKKKKGRIKTNDGFDLILITEKEEWEHWKRVTEYLKGMSNLDKQKVVEIFTNDREDNGLNG